MLRVPFVDQSANPARGARSAAISRRARCLMALAGFGLLALLALASRMRPDPRGWGTHEQLGLPPCTFLFATGLRCPACGMTTSWAYATRGQWAAALQSHVSGTLLAVAAAMLAATLLAAAVRGRRPLRQPGDAATISLLAVAAATLLGEWAVRLWTG